MTVKEVAEKLDLKLLAGEDGIDREITNCYIGDLLSWVMSKAKDGDIWLTVMGNVNAVAVAVLTDSAAIVLVEDSPLDDDAKNRADMQGVPIYSSSEPAYELATKIEHIFKNDAKGKGA